MADYGYEELSSAIPVQTVHVCVPLPHPDRQIRVLDLDPVHLESPPTAQALHGHLRVLNEPADHEYAALSYVWAQDSGTLERENRLIIHCNGHVHEARLGPNCWSALWHVCKITSPSTLTIWVDSICIDQKNDEEKKQQVSLMCGIYGSAQKTYFWLGEATKNTNKAIDFLSRKRITTNTHGVGNIFLMYIELITYSMTFRRYPHRYGLREIFGRQWIKRLWTLQECLLSRNGIIVCGEKSVPWAGFVCALESIHYFHVHHSNPWSIRFDDSYLPWLNLANLTRWFAEDAWNAPGVSWDNPTHPDSNIQAHLHCLKMAVKMVFLFPPPLTTDINDVPLARLFSSISRHKFSPVPIKARLVFPSTLHSLLEELRNREVRDPKDMYNGVVGILGDDAPNTGESLPHVYRRLCMSLIHKTQSLDVLLFANTCADNNYNSWVVNWNSQLPQFWGKALHYMENEGLSDIIRGVRNVSRRTTSERRYVHMRDPAQGIQCSTYLYPALECCTDYEQRIFSTNTVTPFQISKNGT